MGRLLISHQVLLVVEAMVCDALHHSGCSIDCICLVHSPLLVLAASLVVVELSLG